ncbi:MAG: DUF2238 domain-containing protein [Alphaproteobacteria bacterium]
MAFSRSETILLVFTLAYVGAFLVHFLTIGNAEFIGYIVTLVAFIALIATTQRIACFPLWLLWALSLWGLAHMAGGGLSVDGDVLYALVLVPLAGNGELAVLKYDQLVHFYGFGTTALVLWHVMRRNVPALDGTKTLYILAALGAMGLGAVNEIIEFVAVLSLPDTDVGGYANTGLDLIFNAAGAIAAMMGAARATGRR